MRSIATALFGLLLVVACGTEASPPTEPAPTSSVNVTPTTDAAPAQVTTTSGAVEASTSTMMHGDHDENGLAATEPEAGAADRTVEVIATEFAFEPGTITVSAGETVRFVIRNEGAIEHEFRLTTEHAAQEHIDAGHEGHNDTGGEGGHAHGELTVLIPAATTGELTASFGEAGTFDVAACLLPGHYEAGMLAPVIYQ